VTSNRSNRRYKIYPLSERDYIRISYLPREWEVVWSVVLSVWLAAFIHQDIVNVIHNRTGSLLFLVLINCFFWLGFTFFILGANSAFRSGSMRAYGGSLYIVLLLSAIMLIVFLKSINLDTMIKEGIRLNFIVIATPVYITAFFAMVWFPLCSLKKNIEYFSQYKSEAIEEDKKVMEIKSKKITAYLIFLSICMIITWMVFVLPQTIKWMDMSCRLLERIKRPPYGTDEWFRVCMVAVLVVIMCLRLFGIELYYMIYRTILLIRPERHL